MGSEYCVNDVSPIPISKKWIIVPAAGIGSRMGGEVAKQYLPIDHSTVLEHTLKNLLDVVGIEKIILALHPEDQLWSTFSLSAHTRIEAVVGGAERCHSVFNALLHLRGVAREDDWVLVHDAARPCITAQQVQTLIQQLESHPVGGILAVPVSDTLKAVTTDHAITHTVDRKSLWQAQTPQMFRYGLLLQALQSILDSDQAVTDEAAALEQLGYTAMVVKGSQTNIKITHPEDLTMAQLILRMRKSET